jgi:segregation and condensation protein A
MAPYRVNLDIFAGPLDLLLYLVRKDEVEIYDIPIASVTKQYIEYIEMLGMFDIDVAGDFLVMAASLMEIKSAMLLPRVEADEEDQADMNDPRAELVRQLLEYKKFKDAANLLDDSANERTEKFTRPDSIIMALKADSEPEIDFDEVSIWTLLEAFNDIMQATGRATSSYDHIKDDTPIDLYQIEVLHRLQSEGPLTFIDIFSGRTNRLVLVGLFLSMLELAKSQLIHLEQRQNSEEIYVRSTTDEPAEQAVQRAIYATQLEEEEEKLAEEAKPSDEEAKPSAEEADASDAPQVKEHVASKPAIPIMEIPPKGNVGAVVNEAENIIGSKDSM